MVRPAIGSFEARELNIVCPNPKCPYYRYPSSGKIVKASKYGKDRTKKRWRCTYCGRTFSETYGLGAYRKKKPVEYHQALDMREQGQSIRQIAKELKVSKNTVWRWLSDRWDELCKHRLKRAERKREAKKLYRKGWKIQRIARELNISRTSVYRLLEES